MQLSCSAENGLFVLVLYAETASPGESRISIGTANRMGFLYLLFISR